MTDVKTSHTHEPMELSAVDEKLLRELTERVVEGALEGELDDHLGYSKHDPAGRNGGNSRNGHRAKPQSTARIQMIALRGNGPVDVILRMAGDVVFSPLTFLRLVHGF